MKSTPAVGIDIGGTGMKGALIDAATGEKLTDRFRLPTPDGALPDDVARTLLDLLDLIPGVKKSTPVGIAFPSVIVDGVTLTASNIDDSWIGLDSSALFEHALGRPVTLVNDADAAGYAETRFGAAQNVPGLVIVVTLGTGIGTALIYKGRLVPNSELGHLEIDGIQPYEHAASNAAREREGLSYEEWATTRLQRYFETLERLLQPRLFVVGGGVSKKADRFLPLLSLSTPIVPAQHLNNAGILGAAARAARKADRSGKGGWS